MGYTTDFSGSFEVKPEPLNEKMINYLTKFAETRRMKRNLKGFGVEGEFYVHGSGFMGQDKESNVIDSNQPPQTQPGLWCQWVPTSDGTRIVWDGGEKFYDYVEWLQYIEENFLLPFGKYLDGEMVWQGEDIMDRGRIIADKDVIKTVEENGGERSIALVPRNQFKDDLNTILKEERSDLELALNKLNIPSHMHSNIEGYVNNGEPTGGFLQAVIENKLVNAFSKADGRNKQSIEGYATLLYNYFPENSWGSEDAYKNWIKRGGLKGKNT